MSAYYVAFIIDAQLKHFLRVNPQMHRKSRQYCMDRICLHVRLIRVWVCGISLCVVWRVLHVGERRDQLAGYWFPGQPTDVGFALRGAAQRVWPDQWRHQAGYIRVPGFIQCGIWSSAFFNCAICSIEDTASGWNSNLRVLKCWSLMSPFQKRTLGVFVGSVLLSVPWGTLVCT